MKHNPGNRRPRSRGNNKRHGGGRSNYDSNGPEVKVRGTAQQVYEKYTALGRDAFSAGDRIAAESYFQYAEHYHRILSADGNNGQGRRDRQTEAQPEQPRHDRGGEDIRIESAAPREAAPREATAVESTPGQPAVAVDGGSENSGSSGGADDGPTKTPTPRRRRSRAKPQPNSGDAAADSEPAPA